MLSFVARIAVRARRFRARVFAPLRPSMRNARPGDGRAVRRRQALRLGRGWGLRAGFSSLGLLIGLSMVSADAAEPQRVTSSPRATSSVAARKDALAAIPRDKLTPDQIEKIRSVVNKPSVYRRMPTQVIRCDPDLYLFVMDHPEVVANIWQLLGIEDVVLEPNGDGTYLADDGAGTKGKGEFLYRSFDTHLVYAEGRYDGPMFSRPVEGACLVLLKSGYNREPDGHYYITVRLDMFVRLDHAGLDFLAKTFQPLVVKVADYNFVSTTNFLQSLSRTAEVNPPGMRRLAENLVHLDPAVRAEFITTTALVAERSAKLGERRASLTTPSIEVRQAARFGETR